MAVRHDRYFVFVIQGAVEEVDRRKFWAQILANAIVGLTVTAPSHMGLASTGLRPVLFTPVEIIGRDRCVLADVIWYRQRA